MIVLYMTLYITKAYKYNNNNKYLYSALSCVTQRAVTQNELNTI